MRFQMLCLLPSEGKRVLNVGESACGSSSTAWTPEPKFLTYQKLIRRTRITCPRPPTVHCMDNKTHPKWAVRLKCGTKKRAKTTQCEPILRFYYCSPTSRSFLNLKKKKICLHLTEVLQWETARPGCCTHWQSHTWRPSFSAAHPLIPLLFHHW